MKWYVASLLLLTSPSENNWLNPTTLSFYTAKVGQYGLP
jgi:hypothetical protein